MRDHGFRQWRSSRHCFRKKAPAHVAWRLVQKIDKSVCVAVVEWSARDYLHGHPCASAKGLRKALRQQATVVLVDEFRTSKYCSSCFWLLEKLPMRSKTPNHVSSSRQVLCCCNSEGKVIFELGANAAHNIGTVDTGLLAGRDRPSNLMC